MEVSAGEAHWRMGITERSIQTIFKPADNLLTDVDCGVEEAVQRSVTARNSVLHRPDEAKNPPVNEAFRSVLQVLQQVCLTHPPFPVKEHGVMLALIRDEISALQRALAPIG